MVDFAANFTIHATKIVKNSTFYLESVVLESRSFTNTCQSERSLCYFHLGRIRDLFSIHRSSSHTMLAAEKRFRVA